MTVRVCVLGPSGRMGRALIDTAASRSELSLVAAVDHPDAPGRGAPVGTTGLHASADLAAGLDACDVYIDFTTPA